jgi:hypothetical protein
MDWGGKKERIKKVEDGYLEGGRKRRERVTCRVKK